MRGRLFLAVGAAPSVLARCRHAPPRGALAALLDALHHSRRLQAERILRECRHLIAGSGRGAEFIQSPDLEGDNDGR